MSEPACSTSAAYCTSLTVHVSSLVMEGNIMEGSQWQIELNFDNCVSWITLHLNGVLKVIITFAVQDGRLFLTIMLLVANFANTK